MGITTQIISSNYKNFSQSDILPIAKATTSENAVVAAKIPKDTIRVATQEYIHSHHLRHKARDQSLQ